MMKSMPIMLTCTCGQQQYVANEMAGQSLACLACGQALTVPAMGVLLPVKSRAKLKGTPVEKASSRLVMLIFAVVGLLLLGAGGILLAWAIHRNGAAQATLIAQNKEPESHEKPPRVTPPERKRPEPEKKGPSVIEPVKAKDVPKQIVEPVKPKEPPPIVAKKPNVLEPLRLVWKLQEGDVFFQELTVTQKPNFKIQGVEIASFLQYRIVSRFTVKKAHADGSLSVEQKIESAKLVQADDLTKSTVAGAVEKLPGTTYTLHLSPKMDVTKFEGGASGLKIAGVDLGGAGLQMASLIDRDGWKELAQATFFQMDQPLKVDLRWSKSLTHNWGGLGSWAGVIQYAYVGQQNNLHKISYGLQLVYKAPVGGAIGLLTVNGANFQPQEAGGLLFFDAVKGKVVAAEERFRVKGVINANLLGQNTLIEIEEDQHFLIRIHDKLP